MKPLLKKELPNFLERFVHFSDAELRSVEVLSASQIQLTLAVQDKARAYDWITVTLLFSGVHDAKLPQENQLSFIDMSEGANIIVENETFAFGVGACYNISNIQSSVMFIIATELKYEEDQF